MTSTPIGPGNLQHRNSEQFSILSTDSVRYDSTELVFHLADQELTFEPKTNLVKDGKLIEGIQTVKIPKWTRTVKVYVGADSSNEVKIHYADVQLPRKVLWNRRKGHYNELYIKSA